MNTFNAGDKIKSQKNGKTYIVSFDVKEGEDYLMANEANAHMKISAHKFIKL